MRKLFISLILIVATQLSAQILPKEITDELSHYGIVKGDLGGSTLFYDLNQGDRKGGFGLGGELSYRVYYKERWGLGTGIGITSSRALATLSHSFVDTSITYTDDQGDTYKSHLSLRDWQERQKVNFLVIPVVASYQYNLDTETKHLFGRELSMGLYADAGFKFKIPTQSTFSIEGGTLETEGQYPQWAALIHDVEDGRFGEYNSHRPSGDIKLKTNIAFTASAGAFYNIDHNWSVFAGLTGDIGLNNIKEESNELITADANVDFVAPNNTHYEGVLQSDQNTKVRSAAFKLELGVRYLIDIKGNRLRKEQEEAFLLACNDTMVIIDTLMMTDTLYLGTGDSIMADSLVLDTTEVELFIDSAAVDSFIVFDSIDIDTIDYEYEPEEEEDVAYEPITYDSKAIDSLLNAEEEQPDSVYVTEFYYEEYEEDNPLFSAEIMRYVDSLMLTDTFVVEDPHQTNLADSLMQAYLKKANSLGARDLFTKKKRVRKVRAVPMDMKFIEENPFNFEFNKAEVDADTSVIVDRYARLMKAHPEYRYTIIGHTCSIGSSENNMIMGLMRAQSFLQALIDRGIDPSNIEVESKGEEEPLYSNETSEGRIGNRRIEIIINQSK